MSISTCSRRSSRTLCAEREKNCPPPSISGRLVRRSGVLFETRRLTMRVMVLMKATEDTEKGMEPTPEMLEAFAAMDKFTEELVAAGIFVAGAGLKPSKDSKRITFDGAKRTVIDGPFAEARELVAGLEI